MNILDFKDRVFEKGNLIGFSDMEIFYLSTRATTVSVLNKELKDYAITESGGVSFRGIYNGKMGYSYTENIEEDSIDYLLNEALQNAKVIEVNDDEDLFEGGIEYAKVYKYSKDIERVSVNDLIDGSMKMEELALMSDSRIKSAIYCGAAKTEYEVAILNTKGLNCYTKANQIDAALYLMASDGVQTSTAINYENTIDKFENIDFGKIAHDTSKEAISKLGAEQIESFVYPVIFKNTRSTDLLKSLISSFSGENIQKGLSKLNGKLNEKLFGENINIIDDPHMKNVIGETAFDVEGYPTRRIDLVKNGQILSFMHNRKTARKANAESTGNASKDSYSSAVTVGPNNVYLKPGKKTLDEIVKDTEKGLYIIELQGLHSGLNAVSGDFSLYATGFLIENGEITKPVNQITVSGNLFEMLNNVDEIANDLELKGTVSSPSIKINALNISGK